MVQHFVFGTPITTDSVVQSIAVSAGEVPYLKAENGGWRYDMAADCVVYGLGQMPRGINKRGWHYITNNSDESHHGEDKLSYYGAHNFLLVHGGKGRETFGVFIDFAGKVRYDVGYTAYDVLRFEPDEANYSLYILTGDSEADICREFRALIGRSYIPPKWAFGLAQSRWGYKNEADVRAVAENYRKNDLPLDMICMDIDYMRDYADFTVDKTRFADLTALAAELKADGIRLVPIIDAGIRRDDSEVCREGLEKGYFCKKADGTPFVAAVWPGEAYFADFLRPEVREWFGAQYHTLTDCGIEGFWNDMNEPALFYSPERLRAALDNVAALRAKPNLGKDDFFAFIGSITDLMNSPDDYKSFYHTVDGKTVCHDRVHNLYGGNMTRAAAEAFDTLRPGKRTLLYSRSSFIGSHRYGGIWLGDNMATWGQLLANIQLMANVQMCGFLYTGADLCGFGGDTTPDLALRWLEFGLFTPLMRNHSADGTRDQEYYRFPELLPAMRNMIDLRYALVPYLYSEFMKAALENAPYFRPLAFDWPEDDEARTVEDQLLLGEGVMVAPIYTQNAKGRTVYLPEPMKMLRLRSVSNYDEEQLPAGRHYIHCDLDEVLLFIRQGHIVPIAAEHATSTADLDESKLTLWHNVADGQHAEYRLYTDDGETTVYNQPENWKVLRV